jgi:hypothetical protein
MYDIEHLSQNAAVQAKNENAIFDACRANENREAKGRVTFMLLASGDYQAALRDEDGIVVTLCKVDKFDC